MSTGIFVSLALISYNPLDSSFNSIGMGEETNAQNYCGHLGAFIADTLYQLMGLGAWALVAGVINLGIGLVKGQIPYIYSLLSFLSVFILSCIGALYWPDALFFKGHVSVGGVASYAVTGYLKNLLNPIGASVLLWTSFIATTILLTKKSVIEIFNGPLVIWQLLWQPLGWALRCALSFLMSVKKGGSLIRQKAVGLSSSPESVTVNQEPPTETESTLDPEPPVTSSVNFRLRDRGEEESRFFPIGDESLDNRTLRHHFIGLLKRERNQRVVKPKRRVSLRKRVERCVAHWELPKLSLLEDPPLTQEGVDKTEVQKKADLLLNKLEQFSVRGRITEIRPGPAVTMFEFKPNIDVKISRITDLADDLSLALSSESVRIIAPIPGKDVVGIETSNYVRETVYLKDILASDEFWADEIKLPMALGRQADGSTKVVDLRKMPHLLVAGSTGSGKSVFTVSMLSGLLFRHSPKTLRLILVDPKQVDLAAFNGIPHLLMPPIREAKKAISALKWAIREMEKRYRSMSKFGVRDLEAFNRKAESLTGEEVREHAEYNEASEDTRTGQTYYYTAQPYIVVVVEEFGDLMAVDKSHVEQSVVRLAQMARACGIHLVLAMQSPRKDVVTGLIKTNIPGRISFKVASKMDSRIILDEGGAERLLTRGDMLFSSPGLSKPLRHHGPWLSDAEIDGLTDYWREQGEPEFDELAMRALDGSGGGFNLGGEIKEESKNSTPPFTEAPLSGGA